MSTKIAAEKEQGLELVVFSSVLLTFRFYLQLKLNFYSMRRHCTDLIRVNKKSVFYPSRFPTCLSSDDHRKEIWKAIETWDTEKENHMDWEKFQTEYRDYIDLAKMLQLVPVIGAPVGAYANYQLLQRLGEVTMNCYRMRLLNRD